MLNSWRLIEVDRQARRHPNLAIIPFAQGEAGEVRTMAQSLPAELMLEVGEVGEAPRDPVESREVVNNRRRWT